MERTKVRPFSKLYEGNSYQFIITQTCTFYAKHASSAVLVLPSTSPDFLFYLVPHALLNLADSGVRRKVFNAPPRTTGLFFFFFLAGRSFMGNGGKAKVCVYVTPRLRAFWVVTEAQTRSLSLFEASFLFQKWLRATSAILPMSRKGVPPHVRIEAPIFGSWACTFGPTSPVAFGQVPFVKAFQQTLDKLLGITPSFAMLISIHTSDYSLSRMEATLSKIGKATIRKQQITVAIQYPHLGRKLFAITQLRICYKFRQLSGTSLSAVPYRASRSRSHVLYGTYYARTMTL